MNHDIDEILAQCTNVLPGSGIQRSMKEIFQDLADSLSGDEDMDMYGSGSTITDFESEMA
jgi:hypothetical protein